MSTPSLLGATPAAAQWRQTLLGQLRARDEGARKLCALVAAHSLALDERVALRDKCQALEQANGDLTADKTRLSSELVRVREEGEALGAANSNEHVRKLQEKINTLNGELVEFHRKKSEATEQELKLLRSVQKLEAEAAERSEVMERAQMALNSLQLAHEQLQKEHKSKSIEFQTFLDEHQALQLYYNQAELEKKQLQAENDELLERWIAYKQALADEQNALNETSVKKKQEKIAQELLEASQTKDLGELDHLALPSHGRGSVKAALPKRCIHALDAHAGEIFDVRYNLQGTRFASAGSDKMVKIWEASTGKLHSTLAGHSGAVTCVHFDLSDERALSGGQDKAVIIWNLKTGRVRHKLTGHTEQIHAAKFSCDSQKVFSASQDRTIKVWNAARGFFEISYVCFSKCLDLVPSTSGSVLFTAHFDKCIRLWDIRTASKKHSHEIQTDHRGAITGLDLAPDGDSLVTSSKDSSLSIVDLNQMSVRSSYRYDEFRVASSGCKPSFSPDGRYIACGAADGMVCIWDVLRGTVAESLTAGVHTNAVTAVSWSSSGDQLASCGRDRKIGIWTP